MTEAIGLGDEGLGDLVSARLAAEVRRNQEAIAKARLVVAELAARVRDLDPEDDTDAIWDVARALGFEVEFDTPIDGFVIGITPREAETSGTE